jgi:3-oxoacyl-[acyl-carrier protein] reductase
MNFQNKNILVAGGSSGIGLALVNQLVNDGATVYVVPRSASPEWPEDLKHLSADVTGGLDEVQAFLLPILHGFAYA